VTPELAKENRKNARNDQRGNLASTAGQSRPSPPLILFVMGILFMIELPQYDAFKKASNCHNPICSLIAIVIKEEANSLILLNQLQSLNQTHQSLKGKLGALIVFVKMMEIFK
jgi:hypothetical protein